MHPYRTLNVPLNADSETVRRAYLDAIRKHPPESDPETFGRIQDAYRRIETEDLRIRRELGLDESGDKAGGFESPREAIAAFLQAGAAPEPLTEERFHQFLCS